MLAHLSILNVTYSLYLSLLAKANVYCLFYNIFGAILWVFSCTLLGYFFGNIPIIKDNFSVVLILIIIISVVPAVIGAIKSKVGK